MTGEGAAANLDPWVYPKTITESFVHCIAVNVESMMNGLVCVGVPMGCWNLRVSPPPAGP